MDPKIKAEMLAELKKLDATGDNKVDIADAAAIFEELHAKAKSRIDAFVEAHPIPAFRAGVIGGIVAGGAAVYMTLRLFG